MRCYRFAGVAEDGSTTVSLRRRRGRLVGGGRGKTFHQAPFGRVRRVCRRAVGSVRTRPKRAAGNQPPVRKNVIFVVEVARKHAQPFFFILHSFFCFFFFTTLLYSYYLYAWCVRRRENNSNDGEFYQNNTSSKYID